MRRGSPTTHGRGLSCTDSRISQHIHSFCFKLVASIKTALPAPAGAARCSNGKASWLLGDVCSTRSDQIQILQQTHSPALPCPTGSAAPAHRCHPHPRAPAGKKAGTREKKGEGCTTAPSQKLCVLCRDWCNVELCTQLHVVSNSSTWW